MQVTSNQYSVDRLQKIALSLMAVLVLFTFMLTNLQAALWQSSDWLVGAVLPGVVVNLTNQERTENNAVPLKRSSTLDAAAQLKADHMAKNAYFAHYAPDGTTPWHWFDMAGYNYAHAGENLAIHFSDSDEVVEAWMKSPTHRANIVDRKFSEIGVGTARGRFDGSNTVYVVQLFGTPAYVPPPSTPASTNVASAQNASTETVAQAPVVTDSGPTVAAAETESSAAIETEPETTTVKEESSPVKSPASEEATPVEVVSNNQAASEVTATEEISTETLAIPAQVTSLQESMISTSSGLATAESVVTSEAQPTSFLSLATQPNTVMQVVYTLIALAVFLLLILSFVNEMKHARPVQMAYSFALFMLMGGLYWLHTALTQGAIVV